MNFNVFVDYFYEYSLYSLIVSFAVGIFFLILDKPLKKCPKIIRSYSPMFLCVFAVILLDYFVIKNSFSIKQSFAVGVFSGSLSYAVTSFFRKKENGDNTFHSVLELSLIEILCGFTDLSNAEIIAKEINDAIIIESSLNRPKIEEILDEKLKLTIEPSQLTLLKTLITVAVNSLKISNNSVK